MNYYNVTVSQTIETTLTVIASDEHEAELRAKSLAHTEGISAPQVIVSTEVIEVTRG